MSEAQVPKGFAVGPGFSGFSQHKPPGSPGTEKCGLLASLPRNSHLVGLIDLGPANHFFFFFMCTLGEFYHQGNLKDTVQ